MASASAGRGPWHDLIATTMSRQLDVAADVAPALTGDTAGWWRHEEARGRRAADQREHRHARDRRRLDSFDHHEHEPAKHTSLLRDLDLAVQTFFATLAPEYLGRVTLMTMSEFGRTPGVEQLVRHRSRHGRARTS
jgi:uncharacterized protein (DUF1501 family)